VPLEEIIIADSSPLIGLANIGQLGLLPTAEIATPVVELFPLMTVKQ
jgi:hypothetical protein